MKNSRNNPRDEAIPESAQTEIHLLYETFHSRDFNETVKNGGARIPGTLANHKSHYSKFRKLKLCKWRQRERQTKTDEKASPG
jgi:hypothetical protein